MTVKVLLNPYSNRWNAKKRWPEAESALKRAGVAFSLGISDGPCQLERLAADAIQDGCETIVIAGGDGSIGEVINGVTSNWDTKMPFPARIGLLPMGSANDFAFSTGLPLDLSEAAKVIANGTTRPVDLCRCNERYFLNNSGAALEPYVTTKQERIHWIKGIMRYLVAAVWAILEKPEWRCSLKWDNDAYDGPLSLVSVGNCRRTGGFFMTPHADPFDGQLTMAFGYRSSRLGLFAALPRAFREGTGSYVELPGMREVNCTHISLRLDRPSPAHTDGVLFGRWPTELDYEILPAAIPVLMQRP